jgi:hypothetical protein
VSETASETRKKREYTALRWSLGQTLADLNVLGEALANAHKLLGTASEMVSQDRKQLKAIKAYLDEGSPVDDAASPWDSDGDSRDEAGKTER